MARSPEIRAPGAYRSGLLGRGSDLCAYTILPFLLLLFCALPRAQLIIPDGLGYFAYLESSFTDGDLFFGDEFSRHGMIRPAFFGSTTGLIGNPYPMGPAVLWLPWYVGGWVFDSIFDLSGFEVTAIQLGSLFYGIAGLFLMYRFLRREYGGGAAALAIWGGLLGTRLPQYVVDEGSLSQATDFFMVSLFLVLWFRLRPTRSSFRGWFVLGAAGGIAAMVRTQEVLFLIFPGIDLLIRGRKEGMPMQAIGRILAGYSAGFLLAFAPQMVVFKLLNGSWFHSAQQGNLAGYLEVWGTLVGPYGFLPWSPVVPLSLLGGALLLYRRPFEGTLLLGAFILQVLVVSSIRCWWSGPRILLDTAPICMIWLAESTRHLGLRKSAILVGTAALIGLAYYCDWTLRDPMAVTLWDYGKLAGAVGHGLAELPHWLFDRLVTPLRDAWWLFWAILLLFVSIFRLAKALLPPDRRVGDRFQAALSTRIFPPLFLLLLLLLGGTIGLAKETTSPGLPHASPPPQLTEADYQRWIAEEAFKFETTYFADHPSKIARRSARLLARYPRDTEILYARSIFHLKRNALDEAVRDWKRIVAIDPHHERARWNLFVYYQQRNEPQAAARYRRISPAPGGRRTTEVPHSQTFPPRDAEPVSPR